ncbi:anti-sigma factor [Pseudoroseicyclus tamaricis]|uniref:Regulator of SigK n=1 Tax=Pseudoroseicyclus tamaricis TaxID=2705421 RepID=A0A6B2K1C9_9RHOB|nr:anti-sigma factor [Pseudoroseicyclus tamaricis]NDV00146.1 hypothetical protein [Pseudoroseicyclus tamaricis]
MSDIGGPIGDDPRLTAAEYALGLLTGDEARAFEAEMAKDPALAAEALGWGERLARLAETEVPDVAPPKALRRKVERRVFGRSRRRPLWIGLGGLAAAAVVAVAVITVGPQFTPGAAQPEYVATVSSDDESLVMRAAYQSQTGLLDLVLESGEPPPGRVLELWAIAGDEAPVTLGILALGEHQVPLSPDLASALNSGLVLAITDEPPGGAPGGVPTGNIMAAAPLTSV